MKRRPQFMVKRSSVSMRAPALSTAFAGFSWPLSRSLVSSLGCPLKVISHTFIRGQICVGSFTGASHRKGLQKVSSSEWRDEVMVVTETLFVDRKYSGNLRDETQSPSPSFYLHSLASTRHSSVLCALFVACQIPSIPF